MKPFALVLAAALVVAVSGVPAAPAGASWSRSSFTTVAVSSATINPVPALSCSAASGPLSGGVPFTWTAPASGGSALAPQSYTLTWSGAAGSGSVTVPGTDGTANGATLTLLGIATVTVTANFSGWTSAPSSQTRTITTALGTGGAVLLWTCA
ncbi:hypothetical protein ATY41_04800 [Leifsonia xyli subsp. xyli]|uniref:Ig-like domain-containing protein n=2 Tax=Leifsonia xyli subsp. xyli TaxID=59736 RepID=Q6ACL5_LEIXX|nr:hypothetical protein [Leifsonia xyli]AAT89878.1 conserved hypothetical protein [Leifsonia xyli subsp. xyli str. CTCB07]ODA89597.1 hypothetical protein ATY41_04800 [Leifsonia xyli subsp. xyli]